MVSLQAGGIAEAGGIATMMGTAHDESIRNNSFEIAKDLHKQF